MVWLEGAGVGFAEGFGELFGRIRDVVAEGLRCEVEAAGGGLVDGMEGIRWKGECGRGGEKAKGMEAYR